MPDEENDQDQPEPEQQPQQGSKAVRELRATVDRITEERDGLRTELAAMRESQRSAGLAQAGVQPDSYLGEAVLAVAERDSIYGADDIASLAKLIREGA